MKQRRTSLKDLAARLGVSIATVSRALRDSHEVGEEMRRKVQQLAKELNYRPNPFAQSLRKEAPRMIGVVVPNLVTHYYAAVLDGIEDYASKEGYSVISANSHENHEREELAVDNFVSMHVEGIIACLAQDTVDYSHFEKIGRMGIPLVFFARTCLQDKFSSVVAISGMLSAVKPTVYFFRKSQSMMSPFSWSRRTISYITASSSAVSVPGRTWIHFEPSMAADTFRSGPM